MLIKTTSRRLLCLMVLPAVAVVLPARPTSSSSTTAVRIAAAMAPSERELAGDLEGDVDDLDGHGSDDAYQADAALSSYFAELLRATEVFGAGDYDDDTPYLDDTDIDELMGGEVDDDTDGGLPPGVPVGSHTSGRLLRGIPFPDDDPRFALQAPWRAYSTQRAIDGLSDAVDQVEVLYPGSAPLTIGDVSQAGGGRLSPHMSHQIGLDVDIGSYWADGEVHSLGSMHPDQLDIPRTWALLEALVSDDSVRYIILDYRLQQVFYEYAQQLPWMDDEYLELIFQYPFGPKHPGGVIRHWEGHYSHIHVRFACPDEFADTCID